MGLGGSGLGADPSPSQRADMGSAQEPWLLVSHSVGTCQVLLAPVPAGGGGFLFDCGKSPPGGVHPVWRGLWRSHEAGQAVEQVQQHFSSSPE